MMASWRNCCSLRCGVPAAPFERCPILPRSDGSRDDDCNACEKHNEPAVRRPKNSGDALRAGQPSCRVRIERMDPQRDPAVRLARRERNLATIRRNAARLYEPALFRRRNLERYEVVGRRLFAEVDEAERGEGKCHRARGEPSGRGSERRRLGLGRLRLRLRCSVVNNQVPVGDPLRPHFRIFFQAPTQQPADLLRYAIEIRLFVNHRAQQFRGAIAWEGTLAGQHFVEHRAKGPDIGSAVDIFSPSLFRRHVCRRAQNHTGLCLGHGECRGVLRISRGHIGDFRQAEIQNFHCSGARDLDVWVRCRRRTQKGGGLGRIAADPVRPPLRHSPCFMEPGGRYRAGFARQGIDASLRRRRDAFGDLGRTPRH